MAKTRRIKDKKPSSKIAGTSSAEKNTKSLSKSPAKTLVSKSTIPEQNPTDFKGKSGVEATYEELNRLMF
ncbi:hypothetical protein TorRG33x02_038670 [Trema orientale]|uniref:Uncharacterized protein n=1 Tax=Trema orientale TaxID=63057 RepID=A0A2P5FRS1_TREOI|nr:hypothetical protein TorRG33x02_038670 [Trema orientale]